MFEHFRSYYRLRYPDTARPTFLSDPEKHTYPVVDCSEEGFRFELPAESELPPPAVDAPFRGHIRFRSGESAAVSGTVVRVQNGEVAIKLVEGRIAFSIMLREQLFLRRRYPFFFSELGGRSSGG